MKQPLLKFIPAIAGKRTTLLFGLLLATQARGATANLLSNGSFETVGPALGTNAICGIEVYGLCTATGWDGNYQIGNHATVGVYGVSFGIPQPDPDGVQALILQGSSTASQFFTAPATGTYTLAFYAANRSSPAANSGPQTVTVLVDGVPVAGGAYTKIPATWTIQTLNFNLAAGIHLLTFQTASASDVTAFIDNVSVTAAPVQLPGNSFSQTNAFANGSFEMVAPTLGANSICGIAEYGLCSAAGWTGNYQIGNRATAFGIPQPDPDGAQALILQGRSIATQFFGVSAGGKYTLTFFAGSRNQQLQTVSVLIDGSPVAGGSYSNLPAAWTMKTLAFSMSAGAHALSFQTATLQDVTAFIDNVSLTVPAGQPAIQAGGVVSAAGFGGFAAIAPGSWIEIYGSNLAGNTRLWGASDFNGANAPTSLDGTTVSIDGQNAFIDYISPAQVNAQVPSNVGTGQKQVIVTTAAGSSATYTVTVNATEPGLLAPFSFVVGGKQYATALFPDNATYVLPPGAIPGVNSRRARPGDTIVLYGIGFGPVAPSIPAGQVVQQGNVLATSVLINLGEIPATVSYAALAPSLIGVYQFNVVVPNVPASDTVPLTFAVGGVAGTQTLYLAVQN